MDNILVSRSLCFLSSDKVDLLREDEITKENVGVKAYGLSSIPSAWTLPFFVISSEMFEKYFKERDINLLKNIWCSKIIEAANFVNMDLSLPIYLRSNNNTEGLFERGKYESYECNFEELFEIIKKYYDEMIEKHSCSKGVPLLIQQCIQILGHGHISNERRLSKANRDWKGEIEPISNKKNIEFPSIGFSISLRNWRREIDVDKKKKTQLICSSLDNISNALEIPCSWATYNKLRIHFEWIFDGRVIYIVQADEEQDYGINPKKRATSLYHAKNTIFVPKVLQLLDIKNKDNYNLYYKIRNPLIYKELGLNTAPIYLLTNYNEIEMLFKGKISNELEQDLSVLSSNPLVIRTDIETKDPLLRQMLPRTDDIRSLKDAINWLINTTRILFDRYNRKIPFIFIFHNFIPAFSSAFAYAEPNNRNVLIESLWGLPEGLYYYAHDKYVVDTKTTDFSNASKADFVIQQKKIYAKNNFVFPHSNGNWSCSQVSNDYIWKQAIPKESWLKEIAFFTRKISEHVGEGISVMWFVGVDSSIYKCNVFPWHHEAFTMEYVAKQTNRKKNSFELKYTISTLSDINKLKETFENKKLIKYIEFKPLDENIIRNKDVIKEVGTLATQMNAVIILHGGVLSHAYYQLIRTGAAVEVSHNFDRTLLNYDFDKLVRDKIPNKITKSGEIVLTKKLSNDELLEQLRIKLIEESFEVLEAENQDALIQELADVLEVIESIMYQKKISKESVTIIQDKKREKVGGFGEGIILQKTALPLYNAVKSIEDIYEKDDKVSSWTDKKEKRGYSETIKKIKIPLFLKQWDTQFTAKGSNKNPDIQVSLKGKRIAGTFQIEITVSEDFEQLTLFSD